MASQDVRSMNRHPVVCLHSNANGSENEIKATTVWTLTSQGVTLRSKLKERRARFIS